MANTRRRNFDLGNDGKIDRNANDALGLFATAANTLDCGLVAFWKLDEAAGATRVDSGPNNLDLTDFNTVGQVAGIISSAADFNGSNTYLERNNEAALQFNAGSWTISFWAKYLKANNTGTVGFISKDAGGSRAFHIQRNVTSKDIEVMLNGGTLHNVIADADIPDDTWHHIVIVKDTVLNTVTGWINNVEKSTVSIPAGDITGGASFVIGGINFSGPGEILDGAIDEVGIWNRLLNSTEIGNLYNSGAGITHPFPTGTDIATTKIHVNSGVPTEASADGILVVNDVADKFYFRSSGTWIPAQSGNTVPVQERLSQSTQVDIALTDPSHQFIQPTAAINVDLPAGATEGMYFRIRSLDGAFDITLRDDVDATIFLLGDVVDNGNGNENRLLAECHYLTTTGWVCNLVDELFHN